MPTLKLPRMLGGGDGGEGLGDTSEVPVIAYGVWTKDSIHCAESRCQNYYGVIVEEAGTLKAEVYAPWGADLPDFDLVLLDGEGEPIARPTDADGRPRRLTCAVEPGHYFLRVHSRGANDARLKYDIVARLRTSNTGGKSTRVARKPKAPTTAAKPRSSSPSAVAVASATTAPVSTPAQSRDVLVTAEVLDVEINDGAAAFVLLDAGAPQQVGVDMQGQLRDGDHAIGQIVIVEVYDDGSRARVVGDLTGDVGIDTVADIFD